MIEFGQFRAGTANALVDRVLTGVHATHFHAWKWS
jgi:hypothetical protein